MGTLLNRRRYMGGGGGTIKNYLCFEAIEAGTFSFTNNVEYSLDGNTWVALAANTPTPEISAGGFVYWRGNITPTNAKGSGTFSSTGTFNASGDPQSLNYADTFDSVDTYLGFEFLTLFSSSKIVHAGGLDLGKSDTMASYCCQAMFLSCTSLVEAPILPALTTYTNSYAQMFRYCSSLNYIKAMFLENTGIYSWVQGVSRTGTFVKNANATWTDVGNSGVPSVWTIIYE